MKEGKKKNSTQKKPIELQTSFVKYMVQDRMPHSSASPFSCSTSSHTTVMRTRTKARMSRGQLKHKGCYLIFQRSFSNFTLLQTTPILVGFITASYICAKFCASLSF